MRFYKIIGELDRRKLAKSVFSDEVKKERLDMLTLNYIVPKIREEAERIAKDKMAIIDAPLLFETRIDKFCDFTIGVIASNENCIKRVCKRDKISEEEAKLRLNNQNSTDYFKIHCDYIINNEEQSDLENDIEEIFGRKKSI